MNPRCPEMEELLRLLDGELSENRTAQLRAHLAGCRHCADEAEAQSQLAARIAAPVDGVPSSGAAQAILCRLDGAVAPGPRAPAWRWLAIGVGGLAAAAAVSLVVLPRAPRDAGEFRARGGEVEWRHKVGVDVWALERRPRRLAEGAAVAPGTAFVASYSNLDRAEAFLLAFGIDARGEVHWLYPAFADASVDPEAVPLVPLHAQQALPDGVAPEALPAGPLRIVTIVSRGRLRVSSVEALAADERTLDALRARFHDARVDEVLLHVDPSLETTTTSRHP